jgi:hypothetical protein
MSITSSLHLQTKPKKHQEMYCSPARFEMGQKDKTCLSTDELQQIARDYNNNFVEKLPSTGSQKQPKRIALANDKKTIVKNLQRELGPRCGNADFCWIQQDFVSYETKKVLQKAFRPLKPVEWYKNRQTWLNTYDILKVMKQYEDKYKDFFFLGVFPIDFESKDTYGSCVAPGMCNFELKKIMDKGKHRFGMVLNLDKHDQSGSHWVAVYCNLLPRRKNFGIYYYDSVAYPPPKEVASFMKEVEKQIYQIFTKKVADRFAIRYNRIQKQFSNYDCGVFAEVFLTQILKDTSFDNICEKMKTDDDINKLRDVLYTPSKFL